MDYYQYNFDQNFQNNEKKNINLYKYHQSDTSPLYYRSKKSKTYYFDVHQSKPCE